MGKQQNSEMENPYVYVRSLKPDSDLAVMVTREEDVYYTVGSLMQGKYCSVIGPRGIGKTTFLHQVKHEFKNSVCLYLDCNILPQDETEFYRSLEKVILEGVPHIASPGLQSWIKDEQPALNFFDFLSALQPHDIKGKIVLLFDNIDKLPFLTSFLKSWRKIYHEGLHNKKLHRFVIGVTGDVDLIAQTVGPTSPFNISEKIYLQDFSPEESKLLIVQPMARLNIEVQPAAVDKLTESLSGHPQMLQQACYWLVENALREDRSITISDVDNAIGILISSNTIAQSFREELVENEGLKYLLTEILEGGKKKFHPYKEYAYLGSGAIKEEGYYCVLRNRVFETVFKNSGL